MSLSSALLLGLFFNKSSFSDWQRDLYLPQLSTLWFKRITIVQLNLLSVASVISLFGVSALLGAFGKPAEMGLSILAGAIGLAFVNVDKISRFKGAGFEAEMREQKLAESVVAHQTDHTENLKALAFEISDRRQKIMSSLIHTEYNYRTTSGIAKELNLSIELISDELEWLKDNALVSKRAASHAYLWNLTEKGMALLPVVVFRKQA